MGNCRSSFRRMAGFHTQCRTCSGLFRALSPGNGHLNNSIPLFCSEYLNATIYSNAFVLLGRPRNEFNWCAEIIRDLHWVEQSFDTQRFYETRLTTISTIIHFRQQKMSALDGSSSLQQQLVRNTYRTLILGSHILHYHGYSHSGPGYFGICALIASSVVDAYGHLSARHPFKPDIFIMPRNMPPATVASDRDLVEYYVSDASPVDPSAPRGYLERCIHSEIYKKYSTVNSVIHSHSHAVVPYTISRISPFPPITLEQVLTSQ